MINFNKVVGMWFMDVSATCDWLAAVSREEDGRFLLQWRMRYDEKDSPTGSGRSWHAGHFTCSEDEAIEKVRFLTRHMTQQHAEGELFELIRGDKTDTQFWEEFEKMPFFNLKAVAVVSMGEKVG